MSEKHRPAASCTPPTGNVPATKVHAPDRNRTWDPSVRRPTLYPLSHTGFGATFSVPSRLWGAWCSLNGQSSATHPVSIVCTHFSLPLAAQHGARAEGDSAPAPWRSSAPRSPDVQEGGDASAVDMRLPVLPGNTQDSSSPLTQKPPLLGFLPRQGHPYRKLLCLPWLPAHSCHSPCLPPG
uniref:Uncharacterized protein n=1 Tax=Pipistrellus kuhlii TaxID=59472 RepID=A0A7J7VMH5_PIPKU|nr:hypothetical protein mPipKuh1_008373 [Pipistrellus kuhlii]